MAGACPIHHGKGDNFAVEPDTGRWFCHSTCGRGGDILELEAALTGGDFPTRKAEVFRVVGRMEPDYRHNGTRVSRNSTSTAPSKPTKTITAGGWRELARYPYLDRDGNLLFEVVRYLKQDGTKTFIQVRPSGVEAAGTGTPLRQAGVSRAWQRAGSCPTWRKLLGPAGQHGSKQRTRNRTLRNV